MFDLIKTSRAEDEKTFANLIPAPRWRAKMRQKRIRKWIVVFGVYLIILLGAHVTVKRFFDPDNTTLAQEVRDEAARMSLLNARVMSLQGQVAQANSELLAARSVGKQPDWSILMWLMADTSGQDIVLNQCLLKKIEQEDSSAKNVRRSGGDNAKRTSKRNRIRYTVLVGGFANSHEAISKFVLKLEDTGLFEQIRLEGTNRREFHETQAVAFKIACLFD